MDLARSLITRDWISVSGTPSCGIGLPVALRYSAVDSWSTRPSGFRASHLGIKAYVSDYLGPDGHSSHLIPASLLGIRA